MGIYRTYFSLLDIDDPLIVVGTDYDPVLEANPHLTAPHQDRMYIRDAVFTTGIANQTDFCIVALGEADLACRITRVPEKRFD